MQFTISKRAFLNALSNVARAISPNSPLPALSGIKIELNEEYLKLVAADSTLTIVKTISCTNENYNITVVEPGSIVIDSRYLLEMVKKIDGDVVTVEILDTVLTRIAGNKVEYKVNGMRAADYPVIDLHHPMTSFVMDANDLIKTIAQTTFAVSKKESRPVLTGVNLRSYQQQLHVVATDSFRLSRKIVPINTSDEFNVTIPARTLENVEKIIEDEGKVEIYVGDKTVQFVIGDTLVQSRLIDGSFPETERLIPKEHDRTLVVSVDDVLNALDRCSFIKNDGMALVKFCANETLLNISSRNQEIGSSYETITPISYDGEPIEISFSGDYAKEAIRALGCENVAFLFSGEMRAFLIVDQTDDSIVELILPVRTYS